MTDPRLETFKAFLQDDAIRQKYDLSESDVAEANLFNKPTDKMIVVLIREMVNIYFDSKSTKRTANHLNIVLNNRL